MTWSESCHLHFVPAIVRERGKEDSKHRSLPTFQPIEDDTVAEAGGASRKRIESARCERKSARVIVTASLRRLHVSKQGVRLSYLHTLARLDTPAQHDGLYTSVVGALTTGHQGALILDLRDLAFIPADGILALVGVARLWHRETGGVTRLRHMQLAVHQYLERMDLFTRCGDWIMAEEGLDSTLCWERSIESANLSELLPIASAEMHNPSDVARAVTRAKKILLTWVEWDESAINRLCVMLSELASNIVHSRDQGFAIMQRYALGHPTHPGSRVTLAVADLGIGIEASLRQRLRALPITRLHTGADFILHALELGVTSREDVAGTGLYQIHQWVQEWAGTLVIRSWRSRVTIGAGMVSPQVQNGLALLPGTQVTITVRHRSH